MNTEHRTDCLQRVELCDVDCHVLPVIEGGFGGGFSMFQWAGGDDSVSDGMTYADGMCYIDGRYY